MFVADERLVCLDRDPDERPDLPDAYETAVRPCFNATVSADLETKRPTPFPPFRSASSESFRTGRKFRTTAAGFPTAEGSVADRRPHRIELADFETERRPSEPARFPLPSSPSTNTLESL